MEKLISSLETHLSTLPIPFRDQEDIKILYERIKQNIHTLLRQIEDRFVDQDVLKKQLRDQSELLNQPFRIFVAGEFSKGKSFLINVLCGNETVRETNIGPQDTKITVLAYGDSRDNTSNRYVDVRHYPFNFLKICNLVDSPGINAVLRPEHTKITRENIASANLVLFVTSVERTISQEEIDLIRFISDNNRSEVAFVLNKTDVFEDTLIDFIDTAGMVTVTRFLEQILAKETNIRDPLIFPVSTRRAMWALVKRDAEVWERSGMQQLINHIGFILQSGEAAVLKLRSPLNYLSGAHIDNLPVLQGLLEQEERQSLGLEKSNLTIKRVEEDIKQQMVEIHDAIDAFNIAEIERAFEQSLDLFIERFLAKDTLKAFKKMTKEEQGKYVQRELNDAFVSWEKGVDEKKLAYVEDILKRFQHCWAQCKQSLQGESNGHLRTMIDERERREGKTMEESFSFEKQNIELVRLFSNMKNEIRQGNQKAFQEQVINSHNAIERNSTLWTAVSATSLAGAITGVIADLFISGGIISLISIIGGAGGAAGAFAFRDQRAKKIREKMQSGIDKTFETFRTSFNETIRSVFHDEGKAFEIRTKRTFVERVRELVNEKLVITVTAQNEIKELLNQSAVISGEIEKLESVMRG